MTLDATLRDFRAGQKMFGRFTLTKILGRGGMGIVWLAHDDDLDRDVALKFLPEIIVHDRAVVEDLKRETKRSLELTHKNIVRIHDFIHDSISACITMEYIEGDTLSNLRADKATRVFEPDELKPWLGQLCEALDYAHNHARIIHRDLKPSNLMIHKRGQLKIADFGIARSLSDSFSLLTHSQGTSGTLVYMSPQQLDGLRGTHLDDIYSLGATLYELITSKPPFYSGDISRQIRERIPPSMMQRRRDIETEGNPIPKNWEETIAACLAKDPAIRPQAVMEIGSRLGITAHHDARPARTPRTIVRTPLPTQGQLKPDRRTILAVSSMALAVAGAACWWILFEEPRQRPETQLATPTAPQPSVDRLLEEAAALRQRGDTTTALARLQEATDKDPKNAQVLAEMATTYESMQKFDRSTATWRRILDLGAAAGPAYALADTKLRSGVGASTTTTAPEVGVVSSNATNTRASVQEIPAGSTLGISEVSAAEPPDPDADTHLMLRIAVKKRAGVMIDHTRVKIQVYFYDTAGDDIKLTDADVSYVWLTQNHDWTSSDSETLAVTYIRPKSKTAVGPINRTTRASALKPAAAPESEQRKYLGYIVRVYYNDQLQDKRAQPSKLLTLFPAPNTAPPQ
jgi:serine/threonine protein kinase